MIGMLVKPKMPYWKAILIVIISILVGLICIAISAGVLLGFVYLIVKVIKLAITGVW